MGSSLRRAAQSKIVRGNVQFLPNGLKFSKGVTFEEWVQAGHEIKASIAGHQWWIGDWLRFGGHKWGDKYEKAAEQLGLKPESCRKYKQIAEAYSGFESRISGVSFLHHQIAASLDEQPRKNLLTNAAEDEWSASTLRARLKTLRRKDPEPLIADGSDDGSRWEVKNCDVLVGLQELFESGREPRLAFTDPPYNIGIDYGNGKKADKRTDQDYMAWAEDWLAAILQCLTDDGSLWVMINDEYAAEYGVSLKRLGLTIRSWIKWYETFGVNCTNKFNRTSRHIFYCVKDTKNFVFNPEPVTRPSDRQTKYNDPRAAEGGKLWDDVWQIPRLFGTAVERIEGFPTQLPLGVVTPIVECASHAGDLVLDPFNGSGTTGVAAISTGRSYIGIELSEEFASKARTRIGSTQRPLIRSSSNGSGKEKDLGVVA